MSDPYRDGPRTPCPRCGEQLRPTDEGLACERGCGEWREAASLPESVTVKLLGELDTFAGVTGDCPRCGTNLDARVWSLLRFEACNAHGIWLDTGSRLDFARMIGEAAASISRVTALADLLATQTPDAYRELARRIIALEDQLASREGRGPTR